MQQDSEETITLQSHERFFMLKDVRSVAACITNLTGCLCPCLVTSETVTFLPVHDTPHRITLYDIIHNCSRTQFISQVPAKNPATTQIKMPNRLGSSGKNLPGCTLLRVALGQCTCLVTLGRQAINFAPPSHNYVIGHWTHSVPMPELSQIPFDLKKNKSAACVVCFPGVNLNFQVENVFNPSLRLEPCS
jgi:hypothetical protein